MRNTKFSIFVFTCFLGFCSALFAEVDASSATVKETQESDVLLKVEVKDAWLRETPPGTRVSGAYLELHNKLDEDICLLAVESDAFESVEMHEMLMRDGKMSMKQKERITIKAGQVLKFQPGGLHLMLFGPEKYFKAGDLVPASLIFSGDRKLDIQLTVKRQ